MAAKHYRELRDAAERLLDARRAEMLTGAEWEALEAACAALGPGAPRRSEAFAVDARGVLVRSVAPARGAPYEHRCEPASFEAVAHAVDEAGARGCTLDEVAAAEGLPYTQVAVALAFLRERGCVAVAGRRNYPASADHYIDAMTEYHALREKAAE